jgi:predicted ferric reductase
MKFYFELPAWLSTARARAKTFWLLMFVINLAIIFYIWYNSSSNYYIKNPDGGNMYTALGRLTGLLVQYAIVIQVLLIGRITFIEQAFGFDKMNRIHRLIGEWIIVFLVAHPVLLVIGSATGNEVTLWSQFTSFLATWKDVFLAFIGASIFIYVASISYAIVRKKLRYEIWYFLHLLTYVAMVLVFFHELNTGDLTKTMDSSFIKQPYLIYWYVLNFSVFAFVIIYRFIKPLFNAARFDFRVAQVVLETKDTFSVYITGKNIVNFKYKSGQYANITFLQKGMWFTHPFSFSAEHNDTYIRFTMKALGDYTKRLGELKPGTRVILDGPLGLFIEELSQNEKLLFIAGGIGITPIRSMIGDIMRHNKNIIMIYAVRTIEDIAFRKEFELFQEKFPFPIHYVLSTPTPGYESGFLDREKLVRLVPDFFERDVYLCGPPPMMMATVGNLKGLGFKNVNLHYEMFSF